MILYTEENIKMNEKALMGIQGLAFFLFMIASIISLRLEDYSSWALNLSLALMILSAGNVS